MYTINIPGLGGYLSKEITKATRTNYLVNLRLVFPKTISFLIWLELKAIATEIKHFIDRAKFHCFKNNRPEPPVMKVFRPASKSGFSVNDKRQAAKNVCLLMSETFLFIYFLSKSYLCCGSLVLLRDRWAIKKNSLKGHV